MALKVICNGCGKETAAAEVKRVAVREATMPGHGPAQPLATDRVTEGELCGSCVEHLHDFVGDVPEEDARPARKALAPA